MTGKQQCCIKEGTGKTSSLPADRIALSLRKQIPELILVIYLQIKSFISLSSFHSMPTHSGTGGFMVPNDLESGYQSRQRWVGCCLRQVNT